MNRHQTTAHIDSNDDLPHALQQLLLQSEQMATPKPLAPTQLPQAYFTNAVSFKEIDGCSVITCFGRVFLGHYAPVHKEPGAVREVQQVLDSHDVVVGDFNATPQRLAKCLRGMDAFQHGRQPSYLPTTPGTTDIIIVPAFDNVLVRRSVAHVQYHPPMKGHTLPSQVAHNARDLIRRNGLLSDHTPVRVTLSHPSPSSRPASACTVAATRAPAVSGGSTSMRVVTFNVADPWFWDELFPGAADGFTVATEQSRQSRLLGFVVQQLLGSHDLICLQEVPHAMLPRLHAEVQAASMGAAMVGNPAPSSFHSLHSPASVSVTTWVFHSVQYTKHSEVMSGEQRARASHLVVIARDWVLSPRAQGR